MKIGEIIRIIIFSILGYLTMMLIQPWLYENKVFGVLKTIRFDKWLEQYNRAALIVFCVSLLFTILWYVFSLMTSNDDNRGTGQLVWYIGLGLLVIVISIAVYFNNQYPPDHKDAGELIYETLFSMIGLFLFNSLFLLYWLPTVTSTPLKWKRRIVPGSIPINNIMNRN